MDTKTLISEKKLFGDKVAIAIYDIDDIAGYPLIEQAYDEGLRLQKIFNFYDKESELSRLNSQRSLSVSEEMRFVLSDALRFCKLTNGAYDITIGKAIIKRKRPDSSSNDAAIGCTYKDVSIDSKHVRLVHKDVMIDLGSIAKGYIADKIAGFLKDNGVINGMIDARGDMVYFGDYEHIVEIQHPRDENKAIMSIKIKDMCVATSGDYRQYAGDYSNSHIVNQKELISITVVAPSLLIADAYSTALFVSDKDHRELLLSDKDIKVMMIDKDMGITMYNGFESLVS